ncbi:uncharacterized protein LOC135484627 [Lineus longissimus]|uniref:uncharacterized protein LOC135484627 n=1 Tax=Lineus longissimus TaxID=88925 RepID=UPI00315D8DBD
MDSSEQAKTPASCLPRLNILKKCIAETSFAADYSKIHNPKHTQALITVLDDEDSDDCDEYGYNSFPSTRYQYYQDARPVRTKVWKHSATGNKALDRFRRLVEFVLIAKRLFNCNRSNLKQHENMLFFPDTKPNGLSTNVKNGKEAISPERMFFDLTPYKAIGEKSMVGSVKQILNVTPAVRKEHQVKSMMHMLQTFSKFASYPQYVQKSICSQAWFAKFESARVIVKQGSRAECYYFILSGLGVSRSADDTNPYSYDQAFLRKGDTIGEKEILQDIDREATVLSKEAMEVIGLDREDFIRIFKSGKGLGCLDYLKSIDELIDFPLDMLQTYQFACSVHYFRRGAVIVKDSTNSEWIYVIKSGSCQVFKAIKSKPQRKHRRAYSLWEDDTTVAPKDLVFPSINALTVEKRRMSRSEGNLTWKKSHKNKEKKYTPNRKKSLSSETLPQINSSYKSKKLNLPSNGLQSVIYEDTPSLSLVSCGAECILISKQFFHDHLDPFTLHKLQTKVPAYPSLDHIQTALDDKLLWDSYKGKVVNDYV